MDNLIRQLTERLNAPLPGREAQFKMAGLKRRETILPDFQPPSDARVACVLALFHQRSTYDTDWRLTLIERSVNPNDRHSGQISFPGGRFEAGDGSLEAVALRETHEEVGVSPLQISLIGRLTELYIPVSNYLVHPFVGVLQGKARFKLQPDEVEQVLTPALEDFRNPENQGFADLPMAGGFTLKEIPCYKIDNRIIWGATAMIISELLTCLDESGF